jgi:hypothetical protein
MILNERSKEKTAELASENGLSIDYTGFEELS